MFAGVTARAATVGLDFRFDRAQSGNTVDAHRLLHLARESGQQDALKDRFFTAYFTEGEAIGDPGTLARLAKEVGLDPTEVDDVLATDRYLDEVRADEAEARALQVIGSAVLRDRPAGTRWRGHSRRRCWSGRCGGHGRSAKRRSPSGSGGARSVVARGGGSTS